MDNDELIIEAAAKCNLDAIRVLISTPSNQKSTLLHKLLDSMMNGDLCQLSEEQKLSMFTNVLKAVSDSGRHQSYAACPTPCRTNGLDASHLQTRACLYFHRV